MDGPSREQLAALARETLGRHTDWDAPHEFVTWHWDGERLVPGTVACIMLDIHPTEIPASMARLASEHRRRHPDPPAYAYALQIETFGVEEPGPEATDAQRRQYHRDRRNRTFHERADAVESAVAWVADIHGRLWAAAKIRGRDGMTETFYPIGKAPGGHLIAGLLAVALASGMADHGLPGPPPLAN